MEQRSVQPVSHEDLSPKGRQVVQSYIATTAMYDFNVYEKRVMYNLVKLAQSQIEGVTKSGNEITVVSASDEAIEVYNAAGELVARSTEATITLPGRGFYIVRQGSASQKIAL